ncbi:hypothetical protein QBC42DRAFT_299527 [Cladorrhinum samala]|uniref:C2H2-type domain-containing protein n=1 Tax=Cladorrhinum samala TaxID=585594 RepID=A0AAV9HER0_9PEZI|nr:hypothetical protein QBC42DRAFT_299527 [Cladorrhinum samala]
MAFVCKDCKDWFDDYDGFSYHLQLSGHEAHLLSAFGAQKSFAGLSRRPQPPAFPNNVKVFLEGLLTTSDSLPSTTRLKRSLIPCEKGCGFASTDLKSTKSHQAACKGKWVPPKDEHPMPLMRCRRRCGFGSRDPDLLKSHVLHYCTGPSEPREEDPASTRSTTTYASNESAAQTSFTGLYTNADPTSGYGSDPLQYECIFCGMTFFSMEEQTDHEDNCLSRPPTRY